MQYFVYPFLRLYNIIFPDAGRHTHDSFRFVLFTLLIVGLVISSIALAAVGEWP